MTNENPVEAANDADYIAVTRFLFHEAGLLDARNYESWLKLLAEDIIYKVSAQLLRDSAVGPQDYAIIDDDAVMLKSRVAQMSQPALTKAENPPSLTRRFVSNVEVEGEGSSGIFVARSNLLVHRVRGTILAGSVYAAHRCDTICRRGSSFELVARHVVLDHSVLRDGALTILL
jgi:3-phenylpropionate/cinnamic acid dioxygenase small subunit